jgi:hypothetical protein
MSSLEYEWEFEQPVAGVRDGALPSSPTLRRVGNAAARAALAGGLSGLPEQEFEYEGEFEYESEFEFEGEAFTNPLRRIYPDAMMEHLAHAAAEAETEAEAEAFIGALVPLAARLLPRVAPIIARSAPGLVRAASGVVRTLRANPATRPLVRTVPTILRRTTADIARQSARGPVSAERAVRTLAQQTQRVLCNQGPRRRALQRNVALDRQYHRAAARRPGMLAS